MDLEKIIKRAMIEGALITLMALAAVAVVCAIVLGW